MEPTLAPGDYMIITKARAIRAGFVVLVDHPKYGQIVKRVKSITNGILTLEGDSPESTASEDMGAVPVNLVKGRARWAVTQTKLKSL